MFSESRSDDALALLTAPPEDEYALLEFALDWPGLHGVEAQLAAALRLFVITRDPLDWLADRGCAWATANANGDTLELPVYITRDEVQRQMHAGGTDLETTLGTVGESVLVTAAQCQGSIFAGAYPDLAFHGEVPRLLDQPPGLGGLGAPGLAVRSADWEPVGLGAIQDLVQESVRSGRPRQVGRRAPAGSGTKPRLPGLRGRPLRVSRRTRRVSGSDVRRSPLRGEHRDGLEDGSRPGEQSGGLGCPRQGLGHNQRRVRARRGAPPPASPDRSATQRSLPVRQRPQVQALLWTLTRQPMVREIRCPPLVLDRLRPAA